MDAKRLDELVCVAEGARVPRRHVVELADDDAVGERSGDDPEDE